MKVGFVNNEQEHEMFHDFEAQIEAIYNFVVVIEEALNDVAYRMHEMFASLSEFVIESAPDGNEEELNNNITKGKGSHNLVVSYFIKPHMAILHKKFIPWYTTGFQ